MLGLFALLVVIVCVTRDSRLLVRDEMGISLGFLLFWPLGRSGELKEVATGGDVVGLFRITVSERFLATWIGGSLTMVR